MAEYTEYHPLKFWLDPASIAEIVAHIQTYLVNNPINSTTEIETIIHDYLIAHPELIGGVDSVNGQTGEVILTADNISAGENVTIKDVLDSLQDQIDDICAKIDEINTDLNEKADAVGQYNIVNPNTTVNGKLFNFTNKSELTQSGGLYRIYDVSSVTNKIRISGRNFDARYYPLYAFFDSNGVALDHYTGTNYRNITDLELNVPANATTLYVNGQDNANITAPPVVKVYQNIDLSTVIPKLIEANTLTINCFGDSTTDGAFVSGEHGAEYGKSTYPARLQTLLTDNEYDVQVVNSGVAGERTPDATIRVGGFPCILQEDVTIPADNTPQPLGTNLSSSRGRVFGTTIQIPLAGRDGTDFCVYFTATSVSRYPYINMDGLELVVTRGSESPYPNYIAKKVNDNKATIIPKGSMLFTSNDRNDNVNIVMIGINDQYALRMSDWMTMMEKCMQASNRCLIVSSWVPFFNAWYDMTGTTTAEKYAEFLREVNSKFGIYHVDMYALWYEHALEYALASGYLTDLTTEQKTAIQNKLDNHIIPAEFTYNNTEGQAHLNEIGYQVVAMIIFDRLKRVSFI